MVAGLEAEAAVVFAAFVDEVVVVAVAVVFAALEEAETAVVVAVALAALDVCSRD